MHKAQKHRWYTALSGAFLLAVSGGAYAALPPPPGPDLIGYVGDGEVSVKNVGGREAQPSKAQVTCSKVGYPSTGGWDSHCPQIPVAYRSRYSDPAYPGQVIVAVPALRVPEGKLNERLAFWEHLRWDEGQYDFVLTVDRANAVNESNESNNTSKFTKTVTAKPATPTAGQLGGLDRSIASNKIIGPDKPQSAPIPGQIIGPDKVAKPAGIAGPDKTGTPVQRTINNGPCSNSRPDITVTDIRWVPNPGGVPDEGTSFVGKFVLTVKNLGADQGPAAAQQAVEFYYNNYRISGRATPFGPLRRGEQRDVTAPALGLDRNPNGSAMAVYVPEPDSAGSADCDPNNNRLTRTFAGSQQPGQQAAPRPSGFVPARR